MLPLSCSQTDTPLPAGRTVACVLTPGGRGAVATIGLKGDLGGVDHYFRAANGKSLQQQSINRICFGWWGQTPAEEIVVVRTDTEFAELHCHGGEAAINRILVDLISCGAQIVDDRGWLRSEGQSEEFAECWQALARASTQMTAHHLLRQTTLYPAEVERLTGLSPPERIQRIEALLAWGNFGIHLTVPWKVVLCGRPNVGKSSLINALVGYTRSVVFDQPGTTRDVVAVEAAFDGWPVELSDTAGLRDTASDLEAAGIQLARARLSEADVVVIVLDATCGLQDADCELLAEFPGAIVVWNKSDLTSPPRTGFVDSRFNEATPVSAATAAGIPDLITAIVNQLVPVEPDEHTAFPVSLAQRERLQAMRLK